MCGNKTFLVKMNAEVICQLFEGVKKKYNFSFTLKQEQISALKAVLDGNDCVVSLPTGYGKSACFYLLPLLIDELSTTSNATSDPAAVVVVITPLIALMEDQTNFLKSHGVRAFANSRHGEVNDGDIKDLEEQRYRVIYISPEAATSPFWRTLFSKETFRLSVKLIAVDECHCISQWGFDFRPEYRKLIMMRSYFACPIMALSATVTTEILKDVRKQLILHEPNVISVLPDRPSIYLHVEKCPQKIETLMWIIDLLKKTTPDKILIFCKRVKIATDVFFFLVDILGNDAFAGPPSPHNRTVEMYHGLTDKETRERVVKNFPLDSSPLKCVIGTIAFGMGIDVHNIRLVVNWGAPDSPIEFWQQAGRCARDGNPGRCITYVYPNSIPDDTTMKYIGDGSICVRGRILSHFVLPGQPEINRNNNPNACPGCDIDYCKCERCMCCTVCRRACVCHNTSRHFLQ